MAKIKKYYNPGTQKQNLTNNPHTKTNTQIHKHKRITKQNNNYELVMEVKQKHFKDVLIYERGKI